MSWSLIQLVIDRRRHQNMQKGGVENGAYYNIILLLDYSKLVLLVELDFHAKRVAHMVSLMLSLFL